MQRRWLDVLGLMIILGVSGCSSTAQTEVVTQASTVVAKAPASIGRVYLMERQLSFMPPAGFESVPATEIKRTYPGNNPPDYVFANAGRTASIAITLTKQPLELTQLPELQQLMSQHLEKTLPGIQWVQRDLIAINGGSWVRLAATAQQKDEKLHSDMYFTAFNDRMLGINFSTIETQQATLKSAFETSRDSIQITAVNP